MTKKILLPLVAVASSMYLCSCASSKVIINDQYHYGEIKEPTMVIILKKEPIIHYEGDVEPEFGPGDPQRLITDFFKQQLIDDIKKQTSIKNIQYDTCTTTGYEEQNEVSVKGRTESVSGLSKGGQFTCKYCNPTYVLTLSDIYIGTEFQTSFASPMMGANGMMFGGGYSASKKLSYNALVTLFDNTQRQPVEYGSINESAQGYLPVITITEWKEVSASFVRKIFWNTKYYIKIF